MRAISWGLRQSRTVTGREVKAKYDQKSCVSPVLTSPPKQGDFILGKKDWRLHFHTQPETSASHTTLPHRLSSLVLLTNLYFNQVFLAI